MTFPIVTRDGEVQIADKRDVIGTNIITVLTDVDGNEWTLDPRTNSGVHVPLAEVEDFVAETQQMLDAAAAEAAKPKRAKKASS